MKRIFFFVWVLVAACAVCFGQTNSPSVAEAPHSRPLKLPAAPPQSSPDISPPTNSIPLAGGMSLQGNSAGVAWATRMEREEGLLNPLLPAYQNDAQGKRAAAFQPKIVKFGRTRIYSSVGTAVARKNPLCVLDPKFLEISW